MKNALFAKGKPWKLNGHPFYQLSMNIHQFTDGMVLPFLKHVHPYSEDGLKEVTSHEMLKKWLQENLFVFDSESCRLTDAWLLRLEVAMTDGVLNGMSCKTADNLKIEGIDVDEMLASRKENNRKAGLEENVPGNTLYLCSDTPGDPNQCHDEQPLQEDQATTMGLNVSSPINLKRSLEVPSQDCPAGT